jgi:hypothetical protein
MLTLVSIQFRDPDPAASYAIPLRRNPTQHPFDVPEWTPGGGDVFVAWRLDRTTSGGVAVQVGLRSDVSGSFEVKADDATGMNLSGAVPPFTADLLANVPLVHPAALNAPLLTDRARAQVALRSDTWQWSWRAHCNDPWTPLAQTAHRSYTVLTEPSGPWGQDTPDQFVWTDALEFSCKWASGAADLNDAATRITRSFFELGSAGAVHRLSYGCGNYTHGGTLEPKYFDCMALIGYLNTGYGSPFVQCYDVASSVSTFANALGTSLIQGQVGFVLQDFHTRTAVTIGGAHAPSGFSDHELAWGGSAGDFDPVWDACLEVETNPGAGQFTLFPGAPYTGAHAALGYRDRLAVPHDAAKLSAPGGLTVGDNRILRSATPPPRYTPSDALRMGIVPFPLHQFLATVPLHPWQMFEWYQDAIGPGEVIFRSAAITARGLPGPLATIEWRRCPSGQRAREVFRAYAQSYTGPIAPVPGLGEAAVGLVSGCSVVFLRWNLVVQVSRASFDPGPLPVLPETVDKAVVAAFNNTFI